MSSLALRRAAVLLPGGNLVRLTRKQLVLAGLALLLVAGAGGYGRYWWSTGRFIERTDDAYVGGNVTVLAPHVPGFVSQIRVADNQYVKAGDLLVTLDDRDYRAKLAHAEAAVQRQQATLANLHAQYELQQSMIGQAVEKSIGRCMIGLPRRAQQHQLLAVMPAHQVEMGFVTDIGNRHLRDLEHEDVDHVDRVGPQAELLQSG